MSGAIRVGPVAGALVLVAALGGCGGDGAEAYCATLEDQAEEIGAVLGPDESAGTDEDPAAVGDRVDRALEVFRTLEQDAPDDLADEWGVLVGAWAGLAEALETGGPASQEVREAADRLREIDVVQAAAGIEQHARDVCKTELGSTSNGS